MHLPVCWMKSFLHSQFPGSLSFSLRHSPFVRQSSFVLEKWLQRMFSKYYVLQLYSWIIKFSKNVCNYILARNSKPPCASSSLQIIHISLVGTWANLTIFRHRFIRFSYSFYPTFQSGKMITLACSIFYSFTWISMTNVTLPVKWRNEPGFAFADKLCGVNLLWYLITYELIS